MFKPAIPWAAICLLTSSLHAQTFDARFAWNSVSGSLIAAAAKLPESDYSFRPTSDVRSFAQLIGHVADAQFAFCAPLLPQAKPRSGAEKLTSKAELLSALKDSVSFCTAAADRLTDADAAQPVKMFGRDRARLTVVWANIAHSNEHYGNIVTYLRMKGVVPPTSDGAVRSRLYYDEAHGQTGPPPDIAELGGRVGYQVVLEAQPITPAALKNVRILYLRAPSKEFSRAEADAVVDFVKGGGSLLLVLDQEQRQSLAGTRVNDLIEPFGMKLTPDTPYLHNTGGLAKAGEINAADREIPYSGGRAVEGGTPFAYQLDKDGKPAQAFAAWKKLENGGRIVVMGEAMAHLFLGKKEGQRLTGDGQNTVYWGKDSAVFMEEVLAWLVKK
jgi:uncharacterized damage-inducible protein DinB